MENQTSSNRNFSGGLPEFPSSAVNFLFDNIYINLVHQHRLPDYMSYQIILSTSATKEKQLESGTPEFFEDEENFIHFSELQFEKLKSGLETWDYNELDQEENGDISFKHEAGYADALLTKSALYFSASSEDGIFEIMQTASEMCDTGEFARYDPQTGEWEETEE